jgi:TRAP transporter 4TM/12TM fusion protein
MAAEPSVTAPAMGSPADTRALPTRWESTASAALGLGIALIPLVWVLSLPQRLGLFVFPEQIAALILGLGLALVFLRYRPNGRLAGGAGWIDCTLALLALAWGVYMAVRFQVLSEGAFFRPVESALVGVVIVALAVEGLRRVVGWTLLIVFAALVLYALLGHLLPGKLQGRSMAPQAFFSFLGTDSTATLGQTLGIACFVIVPFLLFGRLLVAVGASDVFDAVGARVAGRAPGGSARITIVSSMLFGTVSGSAVANVMANGVVTINLMRRNGYPAHTAAAVEAVSSTGGQIMPPVMGAAAFIMAEYLRVPYGTIMGAALIPAILFYAATWLQTELLARKLGLPALGADARQTLAGLRLQAILLAGAFAFLLGGIFWLRLEAEVAAVYAAAGLALAGLVLLRAKGFTLRHLLHEIAETGIGAADILLICAIAGMIIGLLGNTGLGFTLSTLLLEIGRTSLFALLIVTALVSLVLGMGMPTTGVYLLLATLAAPTLIQLGVSAISAHMFVFYYGMLSMITPPVALAAFAAASVAGTSAMRTGLESVRIAWISFLVPLLFVYQPAVLMQGPWVGVATALVFSLVAVTLVTAALVGYGLRVLSGPERILAVALGGAILIPPTHLPGGAWTEAALALVGLALIVWHATRAGRSALGVTPADRAAAQT